MLDRIEQRKPANTFQHTVYHEVPREGPFYAQRPVSATGYPSGTNYRDNHVSTYPVMYNNQAQQQSQLSEENRRLKARVHDLQSRVDHLLRGQNDIEAGSKTMNTIWDEMVTQLCDLFGASIEDKEDKVAATTIVLSRAREVKSEMIELQAQNAQVLFQKSTFLTIFSSKQWWIDQAHPPIQRKKPLPEWRPKSPIRKHRAMIRKTKSQI